MPNLAEVGFEAICSYLWNNEFGCFLGERPDLGGQAVDDVAWFKLIRTGRAGRDTTGKDDPKQVMIRVAQMPEGIVQVDAGWLNLSDPPNVIPVSQVWQIPTGGGNEAEVRTSIEQVLVRLLEVWQQVLGEDGVAGPIEQVAPDSFAGDPDDPDDMAVPGE